MFRWLKQADAQDRLFKVRVVLVVATLLGMLTSLPLWLDSRFYPLVPAVPWYPRLPSPLDVVLLISVMGSLFLALRWPRPALGYFLGATLFLYFGDQTRGQPWFYLYWILLLATLLPEPAGRSACRIIFAAVYLWAGIHKFNPIYFRIIPAWFVSPAVDWGWPAAFVRVCEWGVRAAPVIEVLIGLLVWLPRLRWWALGAVSLVHGAALLFLGPLGHLYNPVVWPWNAAMIALAFLLFGLREPAFAKASWVAVRDCRPALALTALVCLLPVLNYAGWWDSYVSFCLYSADQAVADIYVSPALKNRLPARFQPFVRGVKPAYNPAFQQPYIFDYTSWSLKEVGVPGLTEPRGYRAVFQTLSQYASSPNDLHMILQPKRGPALLCRGTQCVPLSPPAR